MSNVLIENYRGVDIKFNVDTEEFTNSIGDNVITKKSFSACRKAIDDYIKDNLQFKPFTVISKESGNELYIVGIRKDGRFISEVNGIKSQISEYSENEYIEKIDDDLPIFNLIDVNKNIVTSALIKMKELKNSLSGKPLRLIKSEILKLQNI